MLTENDWKEIANAYDSVMKGNVRKIEGENWQVYKVGLLVRIDIKDSRY